MSETKLQEAVRLLKSAETEEDCQRAVSTISLLAHQGDAEAQVRLGLLYDRGDTVMPDKKESNKWFLRAAKQGHPRGQNAIGHQYYDGENAVKNLHTALEWYKKSAAQGYVKGLLSLASCQENITVKNELLEKAKKIAKGNPHDECHVHYYFSEEGEKEESIKWCEMAANGGSADALNNMGCYYHGGKLKIDFFRKSAQGGNIHGMHNFALHLLAEKQVEEAIYWLKRGAIRGSGKCLLILGHCYNPLEYTHLTAIKNEEECLKYYRKAIVRKNVEVYIYLAELYYHKDEENGTNYDTCLDLCHKYIKEVNQADKKHFLAEYFLGFCYSASKKFLNYELALRWMTIAAENGYTLAQKKLGDWYNDGFHGQMDKNFKTAAFWWQKAADQGDYEALRELAGLYWSGNGVRRDWEKSVELMIEAANHGSMVAKANLGLVYSNVVILLDNTQKDETLCDSKQSIKWFREAAKEGMQECYEHLIREITHYIEYNPKLNREQRDELLQESLQYLEKLDKSHPLRHFPDMRPEEKIGLPPHPNIIPFSSVFIDNPFTLHDLLTEKKNFGDKEKLHIGKQLCDTLIHCQKYNCAVVECNPTKIYILPPRAHEIAQLYMEQIDFFPQDILGMVGEYLKSKVMHENDFTSDVIVRSRVVVADFDETFSFSEDWIMYADRPIVRTLVAPETMGKGKKNFSCVNAFTLGVLLKYLELKDTNEELRHSIDGLLEKNAEKRITIEDAQKIF